jgi:subtilisin family serine protease
MRIKFLLSIGLIFGIVFSYAQKPEAIPGQYIVTLKESVIKPVIKLQKRNPNRELKEKNNRPLRDKTLAKIKEIKLKSKISESAILADYADVLVGFTAKLTDAEVKLLKSDPDVEGVYQDYVVSLGPIKVESVPPEVKGTVQTITCAISKAGGFVDGSSKATWIWILDTGIDLSHPDLNVISSSPYAISYISGESIDDGYGHGTHCAGIAAAKNNSIGVVGVSAGAKVVPVKVLNNASGSGTWSGLISGLNHVAQYDIPNDVVSMSLGGYGYSNCENSNPTLRDAIKNLGLAGTWVCMASGNNGADAALNLPGCINGTKVYTVGSIDCNNVCSSFSNFNGSVVDWVAVGQSVYSTYKGDSYATLTGTSMATPVVAGIIHARAAAPLSGGTVNCKGVVYKIAHK